MILEIQNNMFNRATEYLNSNITVVNSYDDFKAVILTGGFVKCGWDGNNKTEKLIKNETNATIRCIPFDSKVDKKQKCIYSRKAAKYEVIFAKAY